jgi:hypothetical protein
MRKEMIIAAEIRSRMALLLVVEKTQSDGGESGIRTLAYPIEPATCRFHVAGLAICASAAVAHCPKLLKDRQSRLANSLRDNSRTGTASFVLVRSYP